MPSPFPTPDPALEHLDLTVPAELPIAQHVDEIGALLKSHQVIVVAGDTGSGKTTQLPKICMRAGLCSNGRIGHTQPRRVAARAVARRVADEVGCALGEDVGFAVRFGDATSDRTRLKVMTDGILLTEVRRDRQLRQYQTVIVDEAHERSLNIDFLLGLLRRLIERRDDLRVVVTSATIDVQAFSDHFAGAPIVEVSGRTYPVEVRYLEDLDVDEPLLQAVGEVVSLPTRGARDVLVFQTGEREIFDNARRLRQHFGERFEILPLYARLSAADQARVFRASAKRRIVLATNVAETSLTVPNIGYVIDPGLARVNRYSYRSKLERLPVEPISQASADQRKGRCGRVAPGVCLRLYSQEDFDSRPAFGDPEIRRVNLASVLLQMRAFRLGRIERFPFIDPPDPAAVRDAERLLMELGAIDGDQLTDTGRAMAELPIDPRLGRMLVAANALGALGEMLIVASGLAVADPRERPLDAQSRADAAHAAFADERSDFVGFINLWHWLEALRGQTTRSKFERALKQRFLSPPRVREWRELHRQLRLATRSLGWREGAAAAGYAPLHRSIITGSLSLVGLHDERGNYLGARGSKFRLFPGSALAGKTPKWVVAAEVAETQRVYARGVARVEPRWIEEAASHLVKRSYSEPHWSKRRGEVVALETVTLYGLRLADSRRVRYAPIDRDASRALFVREGLVGDALKGSFEFLTHNRAVMRQAHELEARERRRDLLVSDDDLAAFYDTRIPGEIIDARRLARWLRSPERAATLFMSLEDVLVRRPDEATERAYPATLDAGHTRLDVGYRFAPGQPDDGVNLTVPIGVIGSLVPEQLEWSVPGFLPYVVEQWLRALPKRKRRELAPIAEKIDELCEALLRPERYRDGRLLGALAELLVDRYGVSTEVADWDAGRVPPLARVNVRVVDEAGRLLAQGRDLAQLAARYARQRGPEAAAEEGITELKSFPREGVPDLSVSGGGIERRITYPALVDRLDWVDLVAFDTAAEQRAANRRGYARLALLGIGREAAKLRREVLGEVALGLHYAPLGGSERLVDEVLINVAWYTFFEGGPLPETADEFDVRVADRSGTLRTVFNRTLSSFREIVRKRFELIQYLDGKTSPAFEHCVRDVRQLLDALVPADVLTRTPSRYLGELPRYLDAARARVDNLQGKVGRDRQHTEVVAGFEQRLAVVREHPQGHQETLDRLWFLVQELRIGLFAERLGTAEKVSVKRVEREVAAEERRLGLA